MVVYKIRSVGKDDKGNILVRSEYIDTRENVMFKPNATASDVKKTYNKYWKNSAYVVDVVEVKKVDVASRGSNWGIKVRKVL